MSMFRNLRPNRPTNGLKILHLSAYNIANIPYLLSKGINDHTNECSVCVTLMFPNCGYINYPEDYALDININPAQILELVREADVVHMHNSLHQLLDNPRLMHLRPLLALKRNKILHAHGTYHRVYKPLIENLRKEFRFHDIIATPDNFLVDKYPTAKFLPNPIEIVDFAAYQFKEQDKLYIAHSPTYRPSKSTHYLETIIMPILQDRYGKETIEFKYIAGTSNQECLQLRSQCCINFDQILVGTYGLGAQESIAQGIIPIVRVGERAGTYVNRFFGYPHPFLLSTSSDEEETFDHITSLVDTGSETLPPSEEYVTSLTLQMPNFTSTLLELLYSLIENPTYRAEICNQNLNWLKSTHDVKVVIPILMQYYRNLIHRGAL